MQVSDVYSRTHRAILDAAAEFDLTPMHVRILLELYDCGGGPLSTLELEERLHCEGSAIRRAASVLVEDRSIDYGSSGGGESRPGTRSLLTLQSAGTLVAEYVYARFRELGRA